MTDPTGSALRAHDMPQGSAATDDRLLSDKAALEQDAIGCSETTDLSLSRLSSQNGPAYGRDLLSREVEKLREENARLREALTKIVDLDWKYVAREGVLDLTRVRSDKNHIGWNTPYMGPCAVIARSALKGA